ncbi:hypothetical protein GCK72_023390 [Caenorhabditis remanei]|uniref:Uncharacterized protein n=1 Tax=Caenorhabditis remanei TaxID=31234 RepID=A0A6A5FWN6_CAERE|nr:hypothetical protein GCK72_023390 [Caenorhabditis remanei]KAF1746932.1 hypothetical protein GCK72_023390 [Caenorhabditis remanei]
MTSQVDLLDMMESRRERSGSANSIISIPSESGKDCRLYEAMNLRSLIKAKDELDISAFDRTRLFHPRKQRSCHKRAEPVSEEHRKKESSKNSREYTKRNRDEIITCRALFNKIHALKCRFEQILFELKSDTVEKYVKSAIRDLMTILEKYSNFGPDMKQRFGIPDAESFLVHYRVKADEAMLYQHRPNTPNHHREKLEELEEQFEKLTNDKDSLNSSKDKTNFASSKSRLNQRIVRERLKTNCWDCWNEINTMAVQAEDLQEYGNHLKQEIWNNILVVYHSFLSIPKQQPSIQDAQQIDRILEYFLPFSRRGGIFSIKWCPLKIEVNNSEMIELQSHEPLSPPSLASTQQADTTDRMSPIQRPESMDMSQALPPHLMEKLLIQDRLISTTQFTPPALASPSFTLALPTVPAASISALKRKSSQPRFIRSSVERKDEHGSPAVKSSPTNDDVITPSDVTTMKKMRSEIEIIEPTETKEKLKQKELSRPQATCPAMASTSQINPISMLPPPIPLFNPNLTEDVTPFEISPALIRFMEQQQVMAAFLNHAFQNVKNNTA